MASTETKTPTPPYVAWGTFINLIDRMGTEGVPARIDKTYLGSMSGGTQSQIKATLRALGLTNDEHKSLPLLVSFADEPDKRPEIMATILTETFPDLVALGAQGNATQGQLHEAIETYGISADTMRKAAVFFIAAATYAKLPLSPLFNPARSPGGAPRRTGTKRRRHSGGSGDGDTGGGNGGGSPSAMKKAYFDLLIEKAKQSDEIDTDLFDRIEKLVGLQD